MTFWVDTSAFIALVVKNDQNHAPAVSFFSALQHSSRLFTSNFVVDETLTHLNRRLGSSFAYQFGEKLFQSSFYKIIDVDQAVLHQSLILLKKFQDKRLSFTDLTSFSLMRIYKINTAFCFDHDFIKVGFQIAP